MTNYKFLTRLGWVGVTAEELHGVEHRVRGGGTIVVQQAAVTGVRYGEEHINALYMGSIERLIPDAQGRLWAIIVLDDPYYGVPEYLVEIDD